MMFGLSGFVRFDFLVAARKRPWSEQEKKIINTYFNTDIIRSSQEIGKVYLPGFKMLILLLFLNEISQLAAYWFLGNQTY